MKTATLTFLILAFSQAFANESSLVCNDQNSHAVYKVNVAENLDRVSLIPLLADSSLLSNGAKSLRYQEGESSFDLALFAGNSNGVSIALEFNRETYINLKKYEILEMNVFAGQKNSSNRYNTIFLCSKNSL